MSEYRQPPTSQDGIVAAMTVSLPRALWPAAAAVLTSASPSIRFVDSSGFPAARELAAFLRSLASHPAEAATACKGWTAHELVAHLAAGSAEMARLVRLRLQLGPDGDIGSTRPFDEREAPYRAMTDKPLRRRFLIEAFGLGDGILRLRAAGPDLTVTFTGWEMSATDLVRHGRSELAIHRWDLVGCDSTSRAILGEPDLLEHGHKVMNCMQGFTPPPGVQAAGAPHEQLLRLWGRDGAGVGLSPRTLPGSKS